MEEVKPTIELLRERSPVRPLKIVDLNSLPSPGTANFLVIPGGSCDQAVIDNNLHELILDTLKRGGFVAGICNGALVLASAGVLKGKRCTHTAHPKYAPLPEFKELLDFAELAFKGSIYVDEDVVIDGQIITSKPHAAERFAKAVEEKFNSLTNTRLF